MRRVPTTAIACPWWSSRRATSRRWASSCAASRPRGRTSRRASGPLVVSQAFAKRFWADRECRRSQREAVQQRECHRSRSSASPRTFAGPDCRIHRSKRSTSRSSRRRTRPTQKWGAYWWADHRDDVAGRSRAEREPGRARDRDSKDRDGESIHKCRSRTSNPWRSSSRNRWPQTSFTMLAASHCGDDRAGAQRRRHLRRDLVRRRPAPRRDRHSHGARCASQRSVATDRQLSR